MGGQLRVYEWFLKMFPTRPSEVFSKTFATVLLRVFSMVPSAVSLTVLSAMSLLRSSSSGFSWWYGGVSVWGWVF